MNMPHIHRNQEPETSKPAAEGIGQAEGIPGGNPTADDADLAVARKEVGKRFEDLNRAVGSRLRPEAMMSLMADALRESLETLGDLRSSTDLENEGLAPTLSEVMVENTLKLYDDFRNRPQPSSDEALGEREKGHLYCLDGVPLNTWVEMISKMDSGASISHARNALKSAI